jgi:hypothetical protein
MPSNQVLRALFADQPVEDGVLALRARLTDDIRIGAERVVNSKAWESDLSPADWKELVELLASVSPIDLETAVAAARLFHMRRSLVQCREYGECVTDPITGQHGLPEDLGSWEVGESRNRDSSNPEKDIWPQFAEHIGDPVD